jgi:tRNA(Arg) A34 adenosine deaminase TadA
MENELTARDEELLRASFEVALRAAAAGNNPFGAILADHEGKILMEAENTVVTENDITGHAELNLVRMTSEKSLGDMLRSCTLYASSEPCAMCSGAIYWGNIGRVVYGLSQERFYSILGGTREQEALTLHSRDVLDRGGRPTEVIGPALEDEAARVHDGTWP